MPTVEAAQQARHAELVRRLLPSASAGTITSLVAAAEHRVVPRRGVILEPDDTHLMVLLQGFAALEQEAPDGRRAIIAIIEPLQFMGLSRIRADRSASRIFALTPCAILAWPRKELDDLALSDVGVANDLVGILSRTLQYVLERIDILAFAGAAPRIAIILLEHHDLWFGTPDQQRPPLERRDLAAMAMVSREMVGRVIRGWEQAGILRRRGAHRLELLDRAALEREADAAAIWRHPRGSAWPRSPEPASGPGEDRPAGRSKGRE